MLQIAISILSDDIDTGNCFFEDYDEAMDHLAHYSECDEEEGEDECTSITERVPLTQDEFDRFVIAASELYGDSWYSNGVLRAIADEYNFEYEDEYNV